MKIPFINRTLGYATQSGLVLFASHCLGWPRYVTLECIFIKNLQCEYRSNESLILRIFEKKTFINATLGYVTHLGLVLFASHCLRLPRYVILVSIFSEEPLQMWIMFKFNINFENFWKRKEKTPLINGILGCATQLGIVLFVSHCLSWPKECLCPFLVKNLCKCEQCLN